MENGMENEMEAGCTLICLFDLVRIVANITVPYSLHLPSAVSQKDLNITLVII